MDINTLDTLLLAAALADYSSEHAATLLARILDWRDADDQRRSGGAERPDYISAGQSGPANQAFNDNAEILAAVGAVADVAILNFVGVEGVPFWKHSGNGVYSAATLAVATDTIDAPAAWDFTRTAKGSGSVPCVRTAWRVVRSQRALQITRQRIDIVANTEHRGSSPSSGCKS